MQFVADIKASILKEITNVRKRDEEKAKHRNTEAGKSAVKLFDSAAPLHIWLLLRGRDQVAKPLPASLMCEF